MRGKRKTRDVFNRHVQDQGLDFLRGLHFGILRDRRSILYDLAQLSRGRNDTSLSFQGELFLSPGKKIKILAFFKKVSNIPKNKAARQDL